MGLFDKTQQGLTQEEMQTKALNTSRFNILLVIALTAINVILLFTDADSYFLFSASLPYYLVVFAREVSPFLSVVATLFAVLCLAAYFLCFLFGKKHVGWLIAALAMFAVDTLFFLYVFVFIYLPIFSEETIVSSLIDLVIHFYALYYFVAALIAGLKLKKAAAQSTEL